LPGADRPAARRPVRDLPRGREDRLDVAHVHPVHLGLHVVLPEVFWLLPAPLPDPGRRHPGPGNCRGADRKTVRVHLRRAGRTDVARLVRRVPLPGGPFRLTLTAVRETTWPPEVLAPGLPGETASSKFSRGRV